MDVFDFGPLYQRRIPETCRWCDEKMERLVVKKEGSKTSFVFGCRICDQVFMWPRDAAVA